jgi:glycosyltransferase involved in cell wall biosynthesis
VILGVDASNLRAGGGVTHLVELLRAAQPQAHGFSRIVVWGGQQTLAQIEERPWLRKSPQQLLDHALPYRVMWQRLRLAKLAKAAGCAVLFAPGGSVGGAFHPVVTMSRNLLPFEWRELRRYGCSWLTIKGLILRVTQARGLQRADGVIFLTRYAQDVVIRAVGVASEKTAIIPHGIGARFVRAPRAQADIGQYSPEGPFRILYVSIVDMYKHQWQVAEAVGKLQAAGAPLALELVGPAYPPALARLRKALARVDPQARFVEYTGAVPYATLHGRYAAADMCVFASSCENMPNILLEAMASGLPIACSSRGPMPEVLGDGGVYFDPEDSDDIARAIGELISSPALRTRLAAAAYNQVQVYSWHRCAEETFGFLAAVAAARGQGVPLSRAAMASPRGGG